jgi:hypothetical protein
MDERPINLTVLVNNSASQQWVKPSSTVFNLKFIISSFTSIPMAYIKLTSGHDFNGALLSEDFKPLSEYGINCDGMVVSVSRLPEREVETK